MNGGRWGRIALVALALAAVLAGLIWALFASWSLGADTPIGLHGWLAMAVALVGVAVVGGGLMWLAFYSARSGWDDIDREP